MVEAATHSKGALAHSGVFKASTKLATHKAAHSAVQALRTEPASLVSRAGAGLLGQSQTGWVKCPKAGAFTHQQLCTKA